MRGWGQPVEEAGTRRLLLLLDELTMACDDSKVRSVWHE